MQAVSGPKRRAAAVRARRRPCCGVWRHFCSAWPLGLAATAAQSVARARPDRERREVNRRLNAAAELL